MTRNRFSLVLATLAFALWSGAAGADALTVKVGYSAGGGYDRYARLIADHIGRFLPNAPTTSVENVPGAGSLRLARQMMSSEPTDGSVIVMVNSTIATTPLLAPDKASFDLADLRWVGAMVNQPSLCFVGTGSQIKSPEDFLTKPLKLGATGPTSATYIFAAMVRSLFNPNIEIIVGFSGGSEVNLAIERGELDGRCGNSLTSMLSSGKFETENLMGQWATEVPDLSKDVFSFLASIDNDLDERAARLAIGTLEVSYPVFLPAGTSDEVLATYRAAFDQMVVDPEFLADAKQQKLLIDPKPGAGIAPYISELTDVDADVVARAQELIQ